MRTSRAPKQPLYEHLQRCLQYTLDRLGPHGLPLIGRADWNDCLNLNCLLGEPGESFQTTTNKEGKVAESVFIAGLFVLAAKEMADIAGCRGLEDEARDLPSSSAIEMEARRWHMAGMANGSCAPMMILATKSVRMNVKRGRSTSSHRACA